MDKFEVLIGKLSTVDALTAGSVSSSEVSALNHEVRNDSMKGRSFVVQRFAQSSISFFSGAQSAEVFSGLGNVVTEQAHDDSACFGSADLNIKVYLVGDFALGGADFGGRTLSRR